MNPTRKRSLPLATGLVVAGLLIGSFRLALAFPADTFGALAGHPGVTQIDFVVPTAPVNRSTFDATVDWGTDVSTDVLQGSFPIETSDNRKFAWIGPNAQITLTKGTATRLHINAWAPIQLLHDRSGIGTLIVDVTASGKQIGEIRRGTGDNATIDQTFDITTIPADANGNLTIGITSSAVVPPANGDLRQLSLVVTKIALE